jgi:hypothetical protein
MAKNIPEFVNIAIDEIDLLEYNPREIKDKEFKELCKDIQKDPNFLMQRPPLVNHNTKDGTKTVYAGNQRLKAAKHLGLTNIYVWIEKNVSKELQDERMLKDNLHRGEWNMDLLKAFDTSFLQDVGFKEDFLNNMFKEELEVIDDSFDVKKEVAKIKIPKTKPGDMYLLGQHKLLCGNSEDVDNVKSLFGKDEIAAMVYCDPPYNIGLSYDKGIKGNSTNKTYTDKKFNDNLKPAEYISWLVKTISNAKAVTNGNGHIFYWCDPKFIGQVQDAFTASAVNVKSVCFWLKNQFNPVTNMAFNRIVEPCVYGTIGKPYLYSEIKNLSEVLNKEVTGKNVTEYFESMLDIWFSKRVRTNDYEHPT